MIWKSDWIKEAKEITINTSDFETGIYFVSIETGNRTPHQQKLIIVR